MNAHETINDILVHLFNEIWELEEEAIITDEYKDISNNDMHIIEAIGLAMTHHVRGSQETQASQPGLLLRPSTAL